MNQDIAQIIKEQIEDLPFVDKIAGLVRAVSISEDVEGFGKKIKRFPIACNVTAEACLNDGRYKDLVPNSEKKSVIYFEDGGVQFAGFDKQNFRFRSSLRLVVWLNLQKLGVANCSWSAIAALQILSKIPMDYFNALNLYTRVKVTSIADTVKSAALFSQYTYDEPVTQFLFYPFDYFALDILTEFTVPRSCIDAITLDPALNCVDIPSDVASEEESPGEGESDPYIILNSATVECGTENFTINFTVGGLTANENINVLVGAEVKQTIAVGNYGNGTHEATLVHDGEWAGVGLTAFVLKLLTSIVSSNVFNLNYDCPPSR